MRQGVKSDGNTDVQEIQAVSPGRRKSKAEIVDHFHSSLSNGDIPSSEAQDWLFFQLGDPAPSMGEVAAP